MRIHYRTIKNNRVKLLGKVLSHPELKHGELDGVRCCFIPYFGRFDIDGLTSLWGTEKLSRAVRNNGITKEGIAVLSMKENRILAPDGYFRWYFWSEA